MASDAVTIELTILMPCLNEAETLAACITKANAYLAHSGVRGEILIADNGSSDGSQSIATSHGARVVHVPQKGYGAALLGGIDAASGRYIIMGDADDSYDFSNLDLFIQALRGGAHLVMGNRFKGGIHPGAMPFLHRYLGNPVLSFLGKLFFKSPCGDFHCGLRGFSKEHIVSLGLQACGMEFASEMVVKATLARLHISEVPTSLSPDGRTRPPHLRTWRDGWRHLRFLLLYSPYWLYIYPGLACLLAGLLVTSSLIANDIRLNTIVFSQKTFAGGCLLLIFGVQALCLGGFVCRYSVLRGILPEKLNYKYFSSILTSNAMVVASLIFFLSGAVCGFYVLSRWFGADLGKLDSVILEKIVILSISLLVIAAQLFYASFVLGILDIDFRTNTLRSEQRK